MIKTTWLLDVAIWHLLYKYLLLFYIHLLKLFDVPLCIYFYCAIPLAALLSRKILIWNTEILRHLGRMLRNIWEFVFILKMMKDHIIS